MLSQIAAYFMTPGLLYQVLMAYVVCRNAALMAMNQGSFYSGKAVCKASKINLKKKDLPN